MQNFMNLFVELAEDGGELSYSLKIPGYAALLLLLVVFFALISIFSRSREQKQFKTKPLVFSAICVALAMVTSYLKLFDMPFGGSVTLCSMFFICLSGYLYGAKTGILTGAAYGLLQLIIDPYLISFPQMCLDYFFAFGALGVSGFFRNYKYGIISGYLAGVFGRFFFSVLSGILFFADYAPEAMSPLVYSAVYNGSYMGAEAVLTCAVLLVPPVAKALLQVKQIAAE